MPHTQLRPEQLENDHPGLEVVDDLNLPDLSRLEDEQLYVAGMRVVQDILDDMSEIGRTRRQGGISDSKKDRQPVQLRDASRGLPETGQNDKIAETKVSGPEIQESRRRSVAALSGGSTVKYQAPRPHVGADAEMEPGGSWMEAARYFCGFDRPADAGRESGGMIGTP